jgi:uncharacterized phage protein gp47/JayE
MINIPTTQQLFNSIKLNIEAELNIQIPTFGKTFLFAFCSILAGTLKLFYLTIGKVQKNIFVDTADSELKGGTLERWGRVKLGRNPFPARAGQYEVEINGEIGFIIPANTTFKSDDTSFNPGILFVLDTPFTFASTTETITLRSLTAGLTSKLQINDTLTATAPLAGANENVIVTAETVQPLEAETLERYRELTIEAFQLEPQGGAGTDYRLWASDAEGVAQTYPYAKSGESGVVEVFVEAVLSASTDGKGTPTTLILDDVRDVIEFNPNTDLPIHERGRRPLGVKDVEVKAVNISDITVTINDSEFTTEQENLIKSSIQSYIQSVRPKVDSIKIDTNDVIRLNSIIFAIENAVTGVNYGAVEFTVNTVNIPVLYTLDKGEIPFIDLSDITFVP